MALAGILIVMGILVGAALVIRGIYLSARKMDGQEFPMRLPKE